MKFFVAFVAVLGVASGQYNPFTTARPGQYRPFGNVQPTRFPVSPSLPPLPTPLPTRFPVISPTFAPRPSAVPVVNRVATRDSEANIISYENDINPDGSFRYAFNTDNGIASEAIGTPRDFGGNPPVRPDVIQGSYSFTSPEGQVVTITYTADENGYQAQGDAIPTPHPIPEYILRALDFIARNPPAPQK